MDSNNHLERVVFGIKLYLIIFDNIKNLPIYMFSYQAPFFEEKPSILSGKRRYIRKEFPFFVRVNEIC